MLPIIVSLTRIDRSITDPADAADAIAGQYTDLARVHDAYLQAFVTNALAFAAQANADVTFTTAHHGTDVRAQFARDGLTGQACLSVDPAEDLTEAYVSITYFGWKAAGRRAGTYLVPVPVTAEALAIIDACELAGPDTYRQEWREVAEEVVAGLGRVLPDVDLDKAAEILKAQTAA